MHPREETRRNTSITVALDARGIFIRTIVSKLSFTNEPLNISPVMFKWLLIKTSPLISNYIVQKQY